MNDDVIKSVGVVVLKGDYVLLVRHGSDSGHLTDTYGLPAGRIDLGETAIEAAKRELKEETGLVSNNLKQLPDEYTAVLKRKDFDKKFHMVVFKCDDFEGELVSSDEAIPQWIPIVDLDKFETITNVSEAIRQAVEFKD